MSCIIHYERENNYDLQLTQITEKTSATILREKREHKKIDDAHFQQYCMIPNNEELRNDKYHLSPCYKKFTKILASKTIDTKTISKRENRGPALKSKLKILNRSSSNKLLAVLPPVKRPRNDDSAEDTAKPCNVSLRSSSSTFSSAPVSPLGPDKIFQSASPVVLSRNKYIYGPECVICKKFDLVYRKRNQKIRSYPNPATLLNAAEKIKQCAKEKEKYTDLYHEILDKDLIAAEFKCHEQCRKSLSRSTKEKSLNQKGNPSGHFSKVASYIDKYVLP